MYISKDITPQKYAFSANSAPVAKTGSLWSFPYNLLYVELRVARHYNRSVNFDGSRYYSDVYARFYVYPNNSYVLPRFQSSDIHEEWVSGTTYYTGNVVKYNGSVYILMYAFDSGAFQEVVPPDSLSSKWLLTGSTKLEFDDVLIVYTYTANKAYPILGNLSYSEEAWNFIKLELY